MNEISSKVDKINEMVDGLMMDLLEKQPENEAYGEIIDSEEMDSVYYALERLKEKIRSIEGLEAESEEEVHAEEE